MPIYVVAYDLNDEIKRPNITGEIKKKPYAKLSESSYAIETDESPDEVLTRLRAMIDETDNIYIIQLKRPWDGYGPKAVNDWLDKRLTW